MRCEFRPAVRRAALARAGYRCEQCGSREQLELHHIGNRQDRSAFNVMVLCVRCHAKLHVDRGVIASVVSHHLRGQDRRVDGRARTRFNTAERYS